jgi:tetratricopeptide (TPR) repeat protein
MMPLWYAKYVDHLRPDVVVEPTVFLYHDWGWNQLGLQAEDFKTIASQQPPERFLSLMKNPNHPFFYSFGRQFLPVGLDRIGIWRPHGLANQWTASPLPAAGDIQEQSLSDLERIRGIEENREAAMEDPPTNDLYASYAIQEIDEYNWYRNHQDELKALSSLESALYFKPQWAGVYADMASIVESMGYLEMARNLYRMSNQVNPNPDLSYVLLNPIDNEEGRGSESIREKEKTRDRDAREYGHLSEILEKADCPFLSRLAFQWSEKGMKSLN